ncbi:MAG: hypothetical protein LBR61_05640 [Synergistaceae bacterium]|jgi:hypothetical protein|nr:hypothetical protein [Synergistaceae bacterium]
MRRIQFACLHQTLHFQLRDGFAPEQAAKKAREEYEDYKNSLDYNHTKYKILDEKTCDNGSIIVRIKKQLNSYDVGNYLD